MEIKFEYFHSEHMHYITEAEFWALVAQNAYFKAQSRGFGDGLQQQDWVEAEAEMCKECFYWLQEA